MTNEERAETLIALLQDNYRYPLTSDKIKLVFGYADEIRREALKGMTAVGGTCGCTSCPLFPNAKAAIMGKEAEK